MLFALKFKKKRFLCLLYCLFLTLGASSQLSGLSMAYGKDFQSPLQGSDALVNANSLNIDRHQYMHRFWSAAINYRYSKGKLNAVPLSQFTNHRFGLSLSYWYLNDFRLLGKMARSSCKGRMVAMSYKFRSYLTAGVFVNRSKIESKHTFFSYAIGIGFNFWQWETSEKMRYKIKIKRLIIPFFEANYTAAFNKINISNTYSFPNSGFNVNIGIKLARP